MGLYLQAAGNAKTGQDFAKIGFYLDSHIRQTRAGRDATPWRRRNDETTATMADGSESRPYLGQPIVRASIADNGAISLAQMFCLYSRDSPE
jgi:hypothetical protein